MNAAVTRPGPSFSLSAMCSFVWYMLAKLLLLNLEFHEFEFVILDVVVNADDGKSLLFGCVMAEICLVGVIGAKPSVMAIVANASVAAGRIRCAL